MDLLPNFKETEDSGIGFNEESNSGNLVSKHSDQQDEDIPHISKKKEVITLKTIQKILLKRLEKLIVSG